MLLYQMNPEYMGLLFTDPMGRTMVMIGSFLMVTGAFVMKRYDCDQGLRSHAWMFLCL